MMRNFFYLFFLFFKFLELSSEESTTQQINVVLPKRILLNVEQPVLNFSQAIALEISSLPVEVPSVKKALQIPGSLVVFSTEDYSLKVTFEPLNGGNLLEWDVNDVLIISSEEFITKLLWDGSKSAVSEVIKIKGYQGSYRYLYSLSYARVNFLKKKGRLEGLITFTMTIDSG
jgi:hypothetical protein